MSHGPTDDAGGAQPPGGVLQLLLQVEQQLGSAVTVARQVVIPYMGIVTITYSIYSSCSPGHQLDGVRGQLGGGPLVQEAGGGVRHLAGGDSTCVT